MYVCSNPAYLPYLMVNISIHTHTLHVSLFVFVFFGRLMIRRQRQSIMKRMQANGNFSCRRSRRRIMNDRRFLISFALLVLWNSMSSICQAMHMVGKMECSSSFDFLSCRQQSSRPVLPSSLARTFPSIQSTSFLTSFHPYMSEDKLPYIPARSRRTTDMWMGKGDGKKKRKKKSLSSSAASNDSTPKTPAAPRVTNQINIPVKRQIRWAQMNKQLAKQSGTSFRQKKITRTKYRRTWDEEEILEKAEERKRKGQDPDWSVILNRTASSPLLVGSYRGIGYLNQCPVCSDCKNCTPIHLFPHCLD
jgi:hypothetical protein